MNAKAPPHAAVILFSIFIFLQFLIYYGTQAGHKTGEYLFLKWSDIISYAGWGNDFLLKTIYLVLTSLIGLVIIIISLRYIFPKDTKKGMFGQLALGELTWAKFAWHLPAYIALCYFAGFTWNSVDLISKMLMLANFQR